MAQNPQTVTIIGKRWWHHILVRLLWLLFLAQTVAAAAAILVQTSPNVYGFLYSFGVGLYAEYFLAGIAIAPVVFVPFAFAWSPACLWRRLAILTVGVVAFAGVNLLVYFTFATGFFSVPAPQFDLNPVLEFYGFLTLGMVIPPIALRAWRGWYLVNVRERREFIPLVERRREICVLVACLGGAMVLSRSVDWESGPQVITLYFGAAISLLVYPIGFWFYRFELNRIALVFLLFAASVLVGVPSSIVWLIESWSGPQFGYWEAASVLCAFFSVLLLEMLIIRALGYRMLRLDFEKPAPAEKKPVVDPFSD